MTKDRREDLLVAPFCVVVDTRENFPFTFSGFRADSRQQCRPLVIPTTVATLKSGDYSIEGYESRVAIERKSVEDAFSTFGQNRDRFERELERLNQMEFAAVVIEAGWSRILFSPPPHTKFSPKSFYRSIIAWQIRFVRIHWWACDTRHLAEHTTFRLLERFWLDDQERKEQP